VTERVTMYKVLMILVVLVVLVAINSCKGGVQAIKTYDGVGVVVSVDHTAGTVQIKHEDIKGFMTAMTMTFKARRPSLLDGISAGDNVDFTLRDDGYGVVLIKIEKKGPVSRVLRPNAPMAEVSRA
jgi:Cu/Ag efflux protein CusF